MKFVGKYSEVGWYSIRTRSFRVFLRVEGQIFRVSMSRGPKTHFLDRGGSFGEVFREM